ncbi:MAG: DOMON domain-containing protein [Candidatus Hodarchaeales archaeon]
MNRQNSIRMRIRTSQNQVFLFLVCMLVISSTVSSLLARPVKVSENILDGVISQGEYSYAQNIDDDNFILHWQATDENTIFFAMEVKTTGWVSIGIDPSVRMKDADMYFGWVSSNGTVNMIDAFSIGDYGPHPPDTELGGTDDIIEYNGSEVDQTTIIEFKRGIVTTDSDYDNTIPLRGEITIIWAYGTTDNFLDQHAGVSRGTIFWNLQGASILKYDFSQPFILSLAFFTTLTGLLIYVDSKGRPQKDDNRKNDDP